MERKKRSKGSVWEFWYANKIFGTFGVEMRASGQKLVKFCTLTHAAKLVVRIARQYSCSSVLKPLDFVNIMCGRLAQYRYAYSPVATPICSIVNLVAVRSVLFFDMEVMIWVYRCFFAWLPERQLWGTLGICIHPRWPLWTPHSPPDGISFN